MKRSSSLFKSFLLAVLLSATTLGATNVGGKWSGTLEPEGQTGSKPVYMILKQDGNKLDGSVGPDESEQHSLENGKVEGNKLTFDIPLGAKSLHFSLAADGDQITGQAKRDWQGKVETMKISVKRIPEKRE